MAARCGKDRRTEGLRDSDGTNGGVRRTKVRTKAAILKRMDMATIRETMVEEKLTRRGRYDGLKSRTAVFLLNCSEVYSHVKSLAYIKASVRSENGMRSLGLNLLGSSSTRT